MPRSRVNVSANALVGSAPTYHRRKRGYRSWIVCGAWSTIPIRREYAELFAKPCARCWATAEGGATQTLLEELKERV